MSRLFCAFHHIKFLRSFRANINSLLSKHPSCPKAIRSIIIGCVACDIFIVPSNCAVSWLFAYHKRNRFFLRQSEIWIDRFRGSRRVHIIASTICLLAVAALMDNFMLRLIRHVDAIDRTCCETSTASFRIPWTAPNGASLCVAMFDVHKAMVSSPWISIQLEQLDSVPKTLERCKKWNAALVVVNANRFFIHVMRENTFRFLVNGGELDVFLQILYWFLFLLISTVAIFLASIDTLPLPLIDSIRLYRNNHGFDSVIIMCMLVDKFMLALIRHPDSLECWSHRHAVLFFAL